MVIFDLLFSVVYYVALSPFVLLISTPLYFRVKSCAARFLATDMTDEFLLSRPVFEHIDFPLLRESTYECPEFHDSPDNPASNSA